MGDPLGDEKEFPGLLDAFKLHCELDAWSFAFHQARPRYLALYESKGLKVVGISVQESNAADVAAYVARYGLGYTVAADLSGDVFRAYKIYALPTQFFVGPDGVIRSIVYGPLTRESAVARVEQILPATAPSPGASGQPSPSASPTSSVSTSP